MGGTIERISGAVTSWSGTNNAVVASMLIVLIWAVTGPLFHYSDAWQLVINTATNVLTFLMVFLIQRSQNKDSMAVQLKLNEIVAALDGASNRLIAIEELSESELLALHDRYERLAEMTQNRARRRSPASVENAGGAVPRDNAAADKRAGALGI